MVKGYLLVEGMRVGAQLEGPPLRLLKVERYEVPTATAAQPSIWTTVEFAFDETEAERVATALSEILLVEQGWYTNFTVGDEVFVIWAGQIFRYRRGDATGRGEAAAYGRSVGVPEHQLDWDE